MNALRTLIGFVVFMVLFIGGAAIGGDYGAIVGFVSGVAAMMAIAMGKLDRLDRILAGRPLKDMADY